MHTTVSLRQAGPLILGSLAILIACSASILVWGKVPITAKLSLFTLGLIVGMFAGAFLRSRSAGSPV